MNWQASQTQHNQDSRPGLYIVATPIGNLRDITLRALDVLAGADLIACEDTRQSSRLLNHYGIRCPLLSYNDHNGSQRRPEILAALREGKRVALISDAGTPLVSDPGYKLVQAASEEGHYITAVPGASSLLAGLCLAGLPTDRFTFIGFLPPKTQARRAELAKLSPIPVTLVFFESPHRLAETLSDMAALWGARPAAVTRELTKLYEEARRGSLKELADYYAVQPEVKGEIVLVVGGAPQEMQVDIDAQLALLLPSHSVKEAASILAEQTGLSRKSIYARALALSHGQG